MSPWLVTFRTARRPWALARVMAVGPMAGRSSNGQQLRHHSWGDDRQGSRICGMIGDMRMTVSSMRPPACIVGGESLRVAAGDWDACGLELGVRRRFIGR